MNGWDAFTWFCSFSLGLSAIVIFGFFLRDAGGIIRGDHRNQDDPDD
jgi:hypothetical protein